MQSIRTRASYICRDCLTKRSLSAEHGAARGRRTLSTSQTFASLTTPQSKSDDRPPTPPAEEEQGALSRKLEQMTEEGLENSGARAGKVVEEAGFSDDLKKRLEARIRDAQFRSDNAQAFAELSVPTSAGKGTRDIASGSAWSGEEPLADAALRMLDDAHKPLRPSLRARRVNSNPIDLRPRTLQAVDRGTRLANARDKTSIYALSQDSNMSEAEKEAMRRQMKERFQPGARSLPATIAGLQSVASQRIEDAIARGQFKNIPRGKGVNVERDHNADSPFIDTTEYFMNKIIKKQDITPPWIEKQAELNSTAARFRGRLRADWKRHAARVIASRGGSLDEQIARAKAYARAEAIDNPPAKSTREVLSGIDETGSLTHITIEEKQTPKDSKVDVKISVTETAATEDTAPMTVSSNTGPGTVSEAQSKPSIKQDLILPPFRDPAWLSLEASYHTIAVKELNNLTRSYNLMAPDLAKKPYFSLDRELKACFADIAPQLADEIRNRALAPKVRVEVIGHAPGGVLERFAGGEAAKVIDDRRKPYGFKEFWKDLFAAKD